MKKICICGGGALGHVAAGYIAARSKAEVRVLTIRNAGVAPSPSIPQKENP